MRVFVMSIDSRVATPADLSVDCRFFGAIMTYRRFGLSRRHPADKDKNRKKKRRSRTVRKLYSNVGAAYLDQAALHWHAYLLQVPNATHSHEDLRIIE